VHIEGGETIADEAIDALDAVEPPAAEPTLLLQKMENRLVRHHRGRQRPRPRHDHQRSHAHQQRFHLPSTRPRV